MITFASRSEIGGIPNLFGVSYEDAFYPLRVRAYQPETLSHKRRSPKPLRTDNSGFYKRCRLNGIMWYPIKMSAVVSNA